MQKPYKNVEINQKITSKTTSINRLHRKYMLKVETVTKGSQEQSL